MNKRQRGEDGDPCSKKHKSEEGKFKTWKGSVGIILSDKDKIPRGALGARAITNYYDSSSGIPKIAPIDKDELFYFTQLAIWSYKLKEDTNFDNVKLLRAKAFHATGTYYYVTFQAFSPQGVATTFQTKLHYYFPRPCRKVEFVFVRIVPDDSDSDDFSDYSKKYRPSVGHPKDRVYRKRLEPQINNPHSQLPVYLSKYALISYNIVDLHVTAARLDIQSLKLVKPIECVTKNATYRLTFEASLCGDSNNVETFETEIFIPTLFPTTTIEFWDFKKID